MSTITRRGYSPDDSRDFGVELVGILHRAGMDLKYLLNQGYKIKGASTFVGNHYLLSERQRLALVRAVSSEKSIEGRRAKEVKNVLEGSIVNIDGFNTIITLEVALSDSVLLKCMDGTIRDLAALRGTYRVIDKTDEAIRLIGEMLESKNIGKAVFYLDAPVSNSGRLKQRIVELLADYHFEVQVEVIYNVDVTLEKLDNVITSDAIILDKCISWINLNREIMEHINGNYSYVDFSGI